MPTPAQSVPAQPATVGLAQAVLDALVDPTAVLDRTGTIVLDAFKPVNDTWGHDVGDEVLQACADRIAQSVRDVDLVARIGGDEFVLVCENLQPAGTTRPAERITRAIATPIDVPRWCRSRPASG